MPLRPAGSQEPALAFGPYLLLRSQKVLLEGGRALRLGSRALDLLIALAERSGEVVSKNELIKYAWPDTFVEESNLRVHVAALRKILGDGQGDTRYIINIAGRGYSFVAPVNLVEAPAAGSKSQPNGPDILPSILTRVIGRDAIISGIVRQISRTRLVTIVGPGGVGKTTVSLAVAEHLSDSSRPRICFVDLSAIQDASQVPTALATVVGISALTEDPIASLIAYLFDARILFILDNCEHVIGHVTELVERILRGTPMVKFLATSREPLLAEGEQVCHLPPLVSPPESRALSVEDALGYSAVRLFVERATSSLENFELTQSRLAAVATICRRIDGIPLAIELVAARVGHFGLETLAQRFGDDLLLTAKGRRTARRRHQSLRATQDWSYQLLSPLEKALLRRLAVFRGGFSAESARSVAAGECVEGALVLDGLMSLVAKSLLTTDVGGSEIRYRLLHVTRAYSAEKLNEAGETAQLLRRHAQHFRHLLESAIVEWENMTRAQWLLRYGAMIDDVRAALDWSFSPAGEIELGTALTVASLPFGFQLSLIDEFKHRAALALRHLAHMQPPRPKWELRIINAYIGILVRTAAPMEAVAAAMNRAKELAKTTDIAVHIIELLTVQALYNVERGKYDDAIKVMREFEEFAKHSDDPIAILIADRVGAQIYQNSGELPKARRLAERVLRHPMRSLPLIYGQNSIDRQVSMRATLARILWLQGFSEQAYTVVSEGVQIAESDGPASMCQILGLAACPISFWRGDVKSARRLTENLLDYSQRNTFNHWRKLALCFQFALDEMIVGSEPGAEIPNDIVPSGPLQRHILATISAHWLDQETIDTTACEPSGWAAAEILRAAANVQLNKDAENMAAAEARYRLSIQIAQRQGALAWELRTTTSLAALRQKQGRNLDATKMLRAVYEKFKEGFDSTDLIAARLLLDELQSKPSLMRI